MSTRLLIVDDHPNTRKLIRSFLTMPGITFQECASGYDAVARAREFKPHWVTMDIQMPGLNGFDTTRAIKEAHPEARILIVSSFNEPHFRDLAHHAGASGFILKENLLALRVMLEKETKNIGEPLHVPVPVPINFDKSPPGDGPKTTTEGVPVPIGFKQSPPPVLRRILVVDDDKEMRTMFGLLAGDKGYRITQAHTRQEAIVLHKKEPYDLVIVEMLLPNNEGFETLAELRRAERPPKLIATAKSSWMPVDVYSKMAKQLGVHGTLAKPFLPEQLHAVVRNVLEL